MPQEVSSSGQWAWRWGPDGQRSLHHAASGRISFRHRPGLGRPGASFSSGEQGPADCIRGGKIKGSAGEGEEQALRRDLHRQRRGETGKLPAGYGRRARAHPRDGSGRSHVRLLWNWPSPPPRGQPCPDNSTCATNAGLEPARHLHSADEARLSTTTPSRPRSFPSSTTKLWTEYLDFLAENRFNYIAFWNGHPFDYLVKLPKYPEAQDGMEPGLLERNHEMLLWLAEEAQKRNIWLMFQFYNIHTSVYFQKAHNLPAWNPKPTPLLTDYTSYCIERFVSEFPSVGLYICPGEALQLEYTDSLDQGRDPPGRASEPARRRRSWSAPGASILRT